MLVYDHTLLAEPNLLIPGKKPIGNVAVIKQFTKKCIFAWLPKRPETRDLISGNAPTVTGAYFKADISLGGQCVNGVTAFGSYMRFPYRSEYSPTKITIVGVIRHTGAVAGKNSEILSRNYNGSSVPYHLNLVGSGSVTHGFGFYNGTWHTTGAPSRDIRGDGLVHVVVGSYDGSTLKIYIDGVVENSLSYSGSLPTSNTNGLDIGAYQNDLTHFAGDIYAVYMFDGALTDAEVFSISKDPYCLVEPV